jgi:hypothetical protein
VNQPNRHGEDSHPPFRSKRLFSENGQWYFDTREGRQVGPYRDIDQVKKALAVFIAQKLLIADKNKYSDENFVPGSQDGIANMVEEIFEFFNQYKLKGQTSAMSWANQRLRELTREREHLPGRSERMAAITYALNLDV